MDKRFLIEQLSDKLRESAQVARKAGLAAAEEARDGATAAEKRENARVAQEYTGLARGQAARAGRAMAELSALETFRPAPLPRGAPIAIGAIVEVEEEGEGVGRTFFLAPVGAGVDSDAGAAGALNAYGCYDTYAACVYNGVSDRFVCAGGPDSDGSTCGGPAQPCCPLPRPCNTGAGGSPPAPSGNCKTMFGWLYTCSTDYICRSAGS